MRRQRSTNIDNARWDFFWVKSDDGHLVSCWLFWDENEQAFCWDGFRYLLLAMPCNVDALSNTQFLLCLHVRGDVEEAGECRKESAPSTR